VRVVRLPRESQAEGASALCALFIVYTHYVLYTPLVTGLWGAFASCGRNRVHASCACHVYRCYHTYSKSRAIVECGEGSAKRREKQAWRARVLAGSCSCPPCRPAKMTGRREETATTVPRDRANPFRSAGRGICVRIAGRDRLALAVRHRAWLGDRPPRTRTRIAINVDWGAISVDSQRSCHLGGRMLYL